MDDGTYVRTFRGRGRRRTGKEEEVEEEEVELNLSRLDTYARKRLCVKTYRRNTRICTTYMYVVPVYSRGHLPVRRRTVLIKRPTPPLLIDGMHICFLVSPVVLVGMLVCLVCLRQ